MSRQLLTTCVTNAGLLTALYVPLVPLLAWAAQQPAADQPANHSP